MITKKRRGERTGSRATRSAPRTIALGLAMSWSQGRHSPERGCRCRGLGELFGNGPVSMLNEEPPSEWDAIRKGP
jgi:hypothetical protein